MSARLVCAHFSKIVEPRTWRLLITACVFQVVSGRGLGEFGGGSALEVAVQNSGCWDPGFLGGFWRETGEHWEVNQIAAFLIGSPSQSWKDFVISLAVFKVGFVCKCRCKCNMMMNTAQGFGVSVLSDKKFLDFFVLTFFIGSYPFASFWPLRRSICWPRESLLHPSTAADWRGRCRMQEACVRPRLPAGCSPFSAFFPRNRWTLEACHACHTGLLLGSCQSVQTSVWHAQTLSPPPNNDPFREPLHHERGSTISCVSRDTSQLFVLSYTGCLCSP